MTVLQLVFSGDKDTPRIEPKPNPDGKGPDELQAEGFRTVDVGSDLLIKFAAGLSHSGFRLLDITLVDRYFSEIDRDMREELEPVFRALVTSNLGSAEEFKNAYLSDVFVSSIRLVNKSTGNVVRLGQEGVVLADVEEIQYLSDGLNQAL